MGRRDRKRNERKERNDYVYATTKGTVDQITVTIDQRTGAVSFGDDVTNTYYERSYERTTKTKVVARIPQNEGDLYFDADDILSKHFNKIFAVDTNMKNIGNDVVSVTALITVRPHNIVSPTKIVSGYMFGCPLCISFLNSKIDKEKLGWIGAIENIFLKRLATPADRIGIIVDAHLGDLHKFNDGVQPIELDFMLPSCMKLIYASSDKSSDTVINKAISMADSAASQCLDAYASGKLQFDTRSHPGSPFDATANIIPNIVETG